MDFKIESKNDMNSNQELDEIYDLTLELGHNIPKNIIKHLIIAYGKDKTIEILLESINDEMVRKDIDEIQLIRDNFYKKYVERFCELINEKTN